MDAKSLRNAANKLMAKVKYDRQEAAKATTNSDMYGRANNFNRARLEQQKVAKLEQDAANLEQQAFTLEQQAAQNEAAARALDQEKQQLQKDYERKIAEIEKQRRGLMGV